MIMNFRKSISLGLLTLTSVACLSACGGGGGGGTWEKVEISGASTTFAMPSGFKHNNLGKGYQYQGKMGDAVFRVVVYPRTQTEQDRAQGITDDRKVSEFAKQIMTMVKKKVGQKHDLVMRYDGIVQNENGYTVQYTVAADDRTVYDRFYITPQAIFMVEGSALDPKNKDVAAFYENFKP